MTLLPFFLGVWKITKLWRNAQVVNELSLLTEVKEFARQLGVARSIELREVQQALVPITWGILYPKILLPAPAWSGWSDERRRAIVQPQRSRSPLPKAARLTVSACLLLTVLLAVPKLTADGAPQESQPTASQEKSTNAVEIKDDENKDVENKDVEIQADELVGVVVDEDGKPLADVLIDAWAWYPGNETRSDTQGRFRLKFDDARRKIELRVMKDGYSPLYRPQQPLGVRDFKVVLGQKTYIEGVVRDSSGAPAPNIEVRGEQGPQQADGFMIGAVMTATRTDDEGRRQRGKVVIHKLAPEVDSSDTRRCRRRLLSDPEWFLRPCRLHSPA